MIFTEVTNNDLEQIKELQPEGWPDIQQDFIFYINSRFCYPIKTEIDGKVAGIGTAIKFENTGWLAHIIVSNEYRRKGIGYSIVNELVTILKKCNVETALLIATELGKPVYKRVGFKEVTEYSFFKREKAGQDQTISNNILPFEERFRDEILDLDFKISGEKRIELINDLLNDSKVYYANGKVQGYFIPKLKEGLVYAENTEAGAELLKLKCSRDEKVVLPSDNLSGISFLKDNGFVQTAMKGTRMIYGKQVAWQPTKIYSRIGGNFG